MISGAPGAHESTSRLHLHHIARALEARIFSEITCDQASQLDPTPRRGDRARAARNAGAGTAPYQTKRMGSAWSQHADHYD